MMPMKRKIAKALEGSIRKWEKIVAEKGSDKGPTNCPLCTLFLPMSEVTSCRDCPVGSSFKTDVDCSPQFEAWIEHQQDEHLGEPNIVHCSECEKLARKELEFLESLREKVERREK